MVFFTPYWVNGTRGKSNFQKCQKCQKWRFLIKIPDFTFFQKWRFSGKMHFLSFWKNGGDSSYPQKSGFWALFFRSGKTAQTPEMISLIFRGFGPISEIPPKTGKKGSKIVSFLEVPPSKSLIFDIFFKNWKFFVRFVMPLSRSGFWTPRGPDLGSRSDPPGVQIRGSRPPWIRTSDPQNPWFLTPFGPKSGIWGYPG